MAGDRDIHRKPAFVCGFMGELQKRADGDLVESLAELEHEQWEGWTKSVSDDVTPDRKKRWKKNWKRYDSLPENEKEKDRVYARKVLDAVAQHVEDQAKSASSRLEKRALIGSLAAKGSGMLFRGMSKALSAPAKFVAKGRGVSGKGRRAMGMLGAGLTGYDVTTSFGRNMSSGIYRAPSIA